MYSHGSLKMPKKRDKSGEEFWRGKYREVSKENISLKKRIRQLEKNEHLYEEVILGDKDAAFEEVYPTEPLCLDCGKGKIKTINILDRIFEECDTCSYRKKVSGP